MLKSRVKTNTILYWLPRLLAIFAIAFISSFALDAFAPGLTLWQQLGGFLMHMLPSFLLIIFLIIAWHKQFIGGILFILTGLISTPFIYLHNLNVNHFPPGQCLAIVSMLCLPFIVIGLLFLFTHRPKRKQANQ
ncbi:MAG: hypothetical protein HYR66_11965 [Sphingobacteriales bacterium]|nr:hypothetical protein [Sphingobacteriales bacterium]